MSHRTVDLEVARSSDVSPAGAACSRSPTPWIAAAVLLLASLIGGGGITLHPVVGAQIYVNGKLLWAQSDAEKESPVLVLDITDGVVFGSPNLVVVKVFDYGGPGGIYRPVKLATLRESTQ